MLHIKIIAVGKLREKYLQEGIREYAKRLSTYIKLDILEVGDEPCPEGISFAEEERVRQQEGERILKLVSTLDYVVLLDLKGKEMDSPGFSRFVDELALNGRSSISFVIGGSLGTAKAVKERSDFRWSFSPLTFPHQLMRLMLLEQLYRAFRISRGEPYHK